MKVCEYNDCGYLRCRNSHSDRLSRTNNDSPVVITSKIGSQLGGRDSAKSAFHFLDNMADLVEGMQTVHVTSGSLTVIDGDSDL